MSPTKEAKKDLSASFKIQKDEEFAYFDQPNVQLKSEVRATSTQYKAYNNFSIKHSKNMFL